jgi:D-glucosaminate-6-phosphate ammonia-lyase
MNYLDRLGVPRVINASGRMTALGVNTLSDDVTAAVAEAGRSYVDMRALRRAAETRIAELIGAEDALITTGAAAGVALMVAASIAGDDLTRVQSLPDPLGHPNEILLQAGHQVGFGAPITQMIRMAGGTPHVVGLVNSVSESHLTGAFGPQVAAFLYVQSHHTVHKGMLPLARCIELCGEAGVPVLIDAAAEEELTHFVQSGAALVTFSGGKAIGGPTSGIVAGTHALVQACRAQNGGIGRPMKVGKEQIVGLWAALMAYARRDVAAEQARNNALVDELLAGFAPFAETRRLSDEAGRGIERAAIVMPPARAAGLLTFLEKGTPPIHTRSHQANLGIVVFDPRPLADGDVAVIVERVGAFFTNPH